MRQHITRHAKRLLIGLAGGLVLLIGLVLIPYPGPGWLIVFAGLAILATEFAWAQQVLETLKEKYEAWQAWLKRQSRSIQLLFLLSTAIVVVLTIWLLNGYGFIDTIFQLHRPWLHSPIPFLG